MNNKPLLVILIVSILLSGCATVDSINRNTASVNYSDNISREEAKFIAQNIVLITIIVEVMKFLPPKYQMAILSVGLNISQVSGLLLLLV